MRIGIVYLFVAGTVLFGAASASTQVTAPPAYLNTSLSAEERATDLVHRMSIEEKITQLTNQSRAIPRLNIPAYNWWSEALHGVANSGTTEFPEPVGLAATFDTDAIHQMAIAISVEGRIKHAQFEREGHSKVMEGLDFGAEYQHLQGSAMGTRAGNLRRGSVSDGAHGRSLRHGHARRRSALLPGDLHAKTFRSA